jgi:hypothetical protein
MPEQVQTREIEISPYGDVASQIAEAVSNEDTDRYIQRISGDIEEITTQSIVTPPVDVFAAVNDALLDSDLDGVPDDTDDFGVLSLDIMADEESTVTIEVYA